MRKYEGDGGEGNNGGDTVEELRAFARSFCDGVDGVIQRREILDVKCETCMESSSPALPQLMP